MEVHMCKPITPAEALKLKASKLPKEVFEAFNDLIAQSYDGEGATVYRKEVAELIAFKMKISTQAVYNNHYLDIEDIYAKHGWEVELDQPGFNENYNAVYTFTKRRK
jgi:hypothetical protein